ncbi:sodium channel protein Nach-like isoform X2 [Solenopsis invicta]|uniref:sodium channel protein Nach-like isoform X2 n=1 Tax=Solenopsis invicta TaxID=13686 RepID=UPI00193C9B08|nr:sodium channel protein Nach-like isoform X2 [Solenopsis invicta]
MDLGSLYASVFKINVNRNEELEKLLNTYYNGSYDVTNLMKDLTPKCSVMLLKCKLHGFDKNCSDIFEFRKTQDGYCCTFNYVRESDDILELNDTIKLIDTIKVMDLGIERGLTVVMDPLLDDYFYPTIPIKGWKVIVFNPTDYPDMTSGGVTEILAMPLSETFMDITTTAFLSTQIIESFPRNERNCIFTHETHTTNDGTMYTYSDCIVDCKIDSIQESCGCRPFIYPRRGRNQYSWRTCNNLDVQCLSTSTCKCCYYIVNLLIFFYINSVILKHSLSDTNFKPSTKFWESYSTLRSHNFGSNQYFSTNFFFNGRVQSFRNVTK